MKDIFQVMATRRSVKRFAPRPVEMDKILQIIQAGTLAPSSGNIQNWGFIVVSDIEKIRAMHTVSMQQESFLSAMAAVVVTADVEYAHSMYGMRGKRLYAVQNCAAAIENMLLAAEALDLSARWVGAFDEDALTDMFFIPAQHRPQAILLIGYSDEKPEPKETKHLENVVFFNKFGNRVQRPHLVFYDWATEWRLQSQKIKGHAAHAVRHVKQKHEERKQRKEQEPEKPSPFQTAREHIKKSIDSMKKDEYR